MIIRTYGAETNHAQRVAEGMVAAAKTAPKAKGLDRIKSAVLTGGDVLKLAAKMDEVGERYDLAFFKRDADCVRKSSAVVLLGANHTPTGLNEACQFCGYENCRESEEKSGKCVFCDIDLGIAVGSAVSFAEDMRVDTRVLFSGGRAACEMNIFSKPLDIILAIPVAVSAKSPFFDRG